MKACFQIASAAYFLRKDMKKYPLAQIICVFWSFYLIQNHWQEGINRGYSFFSLAPLIC